MAKKKRVPKSKPIPNPELACEAFLAGVPEGIYAALPADIVGVVDRVAGDLLARRPGLAKRPLALRVLTARGVRAHGRAVGWEFDEDKCRAFLDLLIEYLPIFIALI